MTDRTTRAKRALELAERVVMLKGCTGMSGHDEGSVGAFASEDEAAAHARTAYEPECEIHGAIANRLYAQLAARDATIARLTEALEPFAKAANCYDESPDCPDDEDCNQGAVSVGELRAARTALTPAAERDGSGVMRSAIEKAMADLNDTWSFSSEEQEHIAECMNDVFNAAHYDGGAGPLDVVRRLREMADAEKAEADARGEAGATRASLLNRAAGMRFAADTLEREIRKAGG